MENSDLLNRVQHIDAALRDYIFGLYADPRFKNLEIALIVEGKRTLQPSKVILKSNADITIPNSNAAEGLITAKAEELLSHEDMRCHLILNLTFKVLNGISPQKQRAKIEKDEQERLDGIAVCEPKFHMDEVVLPPQTHSDIMNAVSAIENSDLINNQWGWSKAKSSKVIICFYGSPGTGKTMCAHAIAHHLHKKILIASYADIQSMYVGEGPKNLNAVFTKAETEDALLFFDEADSFLRKRTSDTTSSAAMHYNSMTNEMMKHLEDFSGIVVFATNLTDNTDEAFKTRITASVEFQIPNLENRAEIIQKTIPVKVPLVRSFTQEDYLHIAEECDGFVGRDIRNAIHQVLCEGAKNKTYPFSVDSFLKGFESYKQEKKNFTKDMPNSSNNSNDVSTQISLMTTNGSVMALLTYAAWVDGPETENETEVLKKMSKLLGRTKPIINKLSDLPSLEEICDEIKHTKAVSYTIAYLCEILACSDVFNKDFVKDILNKLGIEDNIMDDLVSYSEQLKQLNQLQVIINDTLKDYEK